MTGYAKYAGNRYNAGQGGVSTVFNFFANDEEDSFSLVDNTPAPRQRYGARGKFQNRNFQRRNWNQATVEGGDMGKGAERERAPAAHAV